MTLDLFFEKTLMSAVDFQVVLGIEIANFAHEAYEVAFAC